MVRGALEYLLGLISNFIAIAVSFLVGWTQAVVVGLGWEPTASATCPLPGNWRAVCAESVSKPALHILGLLPNLNVPAGDLGCGWEVLHCPLSSEEKSVVTKVKGDSIATITVSQT